MEELLQKIFMNLPPKVKNNKIIIEAGRTILKYIKNLPKGTQFNICVNKSIYQKIANPPQDLQISDENLFSLNKVSISQSIFVELNRLDERYIFDILYVSGIESTSLIIKIDDYTTIVNERLTSGLIELKSYEFNVYCYDQNYRAMTLPDYEKRLLEDFASTFGLSVEEAIALRPNFPHNLAELNAKRVKYINDTQNQITKEEIEYTRSFSITELTNVVNETINKKYNLNNPNLIGKGYLESLEIVISQTIGYSEKIIVSRNFIECLIKAFAFSESNLSLNRVTIIKKVNNEYFSYHIIDQDGLLNCQSRLLSQEDIQRILMNNLANENLNDLEDFFGINRGRK